MVRHKTKFKPVVIDKLSQPQQRTAKLRRRKLDILGRLALRPEKVPDLYVESVLQNELFIKPPNIDSHEKTEELLALQNDREHNEMLQLQEDLLEQEKRQNHINRNRVEELYELQNQSRERFIEANNFFKDCDEKKTFAEFKVSEEKQTHIRLRSAISEYKEKIRVLSEFKDELKQIVDDFEPFEGVFQKVVASKGNNWASTKDVIYGCDALMMAQVEIVEMQRQKLQEIEELRVQMIKITNEAMLTVLGLKNELSELERAYVKTLSECLKIEKIIGSTKDSVNDINLTKYRILNEIRMMYKIVCNRRGITLSYPINEVEKQLDFIKNEIGIIRAVIQECLYPSKKHKTKMKL